MGFHVLQTVRATGGWGAMATDDENPQCDFSPGAYRGDLLLSPPVGRRWLQRCDCSTTVSFQRTNHLSSASPETDTRPRAWSRTSSKLRFNSAGRSRNSRGFLADQGPASPAREQLTCHTNPLSMRSSKPRGTSSTRSYSTPFFDKVIERRSKFEVFAVLDRSNQTMNSRV